MPQDKECQINYYVKMANNSCYKNLKLLLWLRSLNIIGYAIAIMIARHILRIELQHEVWIWSFVGALMVTNLLTVVRIKTTKYIGEVEFFFQLMVDLMALFGLLYFTGGATNPFAPLFILQVIIAAITLSPPYAWATTFISIVLYTALMFWNVEFRYITRYFTGNYFDLHEEWRWTSFILLASIIAWFAGRMAKTIRKQDQLLAEAERIFMLGAFVTSAAHELGTPLSTIAIIAHELEHNAQLIDKKQYHILNTEISCCKAILNQIAASAGMLRAESGNRASLNEFIENAITKIKKQSPELQIEYELDSTLPTVYILGEYSLEQALLNILKNAIDAAAKTVYIKAYCRRNNFYLTITDDGVGIPASIIEQIGMPGISDKPQGMGIGLYLAKTVVMRLNGTIQFSNLEQGGTIASITLPLKELRL